MRYSLLHWMGLFLFLSFSTYGQILEPVAWDVHAVAIDDNTYDLVFEANLDEGWAIYSPNLESLEGPIPTSFNFEEGDHFKRVDPLHECDLHRKSSFDPIFEMDLIKFSKRALFIQRIELNDPSKKISGYVNYMTCDDQRCLPPTDADFSIRPAEDALKIDGYRREALCTDQYELSSVEGKPEDESGQQEGLLEPAKWSFEIKSLDEKNTYALNAIVDIDEGWQVYSQNIKEGGPVPTTFIFDTANHYSLVGEVSETAEIRDEGMDPFFKMKLVKFKKQATFTQKVKVTDPSKKIEGSLQFMTCDDSRCLPPTWVDFEFIPAGNIAREKGAEEELSGSEAAVGKEERTGKGTPVYHEFDYELAESSCTELNATGQEDKDLKSFWWIFIAGFIGGLIALVTPCVFPMIPLTVSFFTKSSQDRVSGLRNAITYGLSIIVIYVALGMIITLAFGADALNALSTNPWFNIAFGLLFLIFAISFFGYFEITLPSSWANTSDRMADQGGLIGIFFMAFTLSLVSFSCTGPIIGTLLVETATGGGPTLPGGIPIGPLVGMFGFAFALALPFGLFAAFPGWLNTLPKSGSWMNTVKVSLGFVEIALALKFFSIADLTMGWKILPYEVFVALWVLCALGLALYYFGYLRFPHDIKIKKLSAGRSALGIAMLLLAAYLGMGFRYSEKAQGFKTPNLLSGLAPPAGHSYIFPNECPLNLNCYKDFQEGLTYAKQVDKPILLDFTGYGCVNCRRMEDQVWGRKGVYNLIKNEYVLISLYVDDKHALKASYTSSFSGKERSTIGEKWSDFQAIHFNRNSQPYYVLVSPDGTILNEPVAYTPDKKKYQAFLECGLQRYRDMMSSRQ